MLAVLVGRCLSSGRCSNLTAPGARIERARETTGVDEGAVVARTDAGREDATEAAGEAERTEAGAGEADVRTEDAERDETDGGRAVVADLVDGAAEVAER